MRLFTRTLIASLAALPLALSLPSMAQAAPCRDAKGKFVKCPPAKPVAKPAPKVAVVKKVAVAKVTVKKGPCKDAKGKFIKCK